VLVWWRLWTLNEWMDCLYVCVCVLPPVVHWALVVVLVVYDGQVSERRCVVVGEVSLQLLLFIYYY
jgi:hypothetical protein